MSGSKAKAARSDLRESINDASRNFVIEPEYPALTPQELEETVKTRLRKSRLAFQHAGRSVKLLSPNDVYDTLIGSRADASHASVSRVDEWLNGWRMPADQELPDVRTSLTTYVGFVESRDMPSSSSRLNGKVPYALITTRFIDLCWKLTEVFPIFIAGVVPSNNVEVGSNSRGLLFTHLGLTDDRREIAEKLIDSHRDDILSERVTSAAIRWAIAHEMAHIHGSKTDRTDAYLRAEKSYPEIVDEQWRPKRNDLSRFDSSVEHYQNEIACDLLANQYVLDSSFSTHDIITQAIGSLVALEALIWDGWDFDEQKVSETHPSPSLRLDLVAKDWARIFADPETWTKCEAPGPFAMADFAYMLAFDRWARGVYNEHRDGAIWDWDLKRDLSDLKSVVPQGGVDHVYAQRPEGSLRVRKV